MDSLVTPVQMLPPGGSICGRLTEDLLLGCLQGGALDLHGGTIERQAPMGGYTAGMSTRGDTCTSSPLAGDPPERCRRRCLVANRATLLEKWSLPPWRVAGSCRWTQRLNQLNQRSCLFINAGMNRTPGSGETWGGEWRGACFGFRMQQGHTMDYYQPKTVVSCLGI
jgi:hypothetical protein